MTFQQILSQALLLPVAERAELIEALDASLEASLPVEVEEELQRRAARYDAGLETVQDVDEAMTKLRAVARRNGDGR